MPLRTFLIALGVMITMVASSAAQDDRQQIESFDTELRLPHDWSVVSGDWKQTDGVLLASSLESESYITFGDPTWMNYEVDVTVTFLKVRDPSRWVSVLVRGSRDCEPPWSQVPVRFDATQKNGTEFAVRTSPGQWSIRGEASASASCELNQPRHLKVVVRQSKVDVFLDDEKCLTSYFCVDRAGGCVGLGVSGCIASFDNFSVRHLPAEAEPATVPTTACDIVAHRGFSAVAPENTLAAISQAIDVGASGCEFDVYECRDGTVVLMHDKTVDRTTDGHGFVTQLSLEKLRQLDAGSWKSPDFAGESIPTLKEALRRLSGTGCQAVIEIKMEGISEQVVNDVRELGLVDQVAVIAFSKNVVREIRSLEPKITCAWLYGETPKGTVSEQADWLEAQAQECNAELLDLNYKMLSPALVAELKQRGLGVWTWTVNESAVMRALRRWGVDSITTDRPDLLAAEIRGRD